MLGKSLIRLVACGGVFALGIAGLEGVDATYDAARPDCPGQATCPLTGELVCKNRCPLVGAANDSVSDKTPLCCRQPADSWDRSSEE